MIRIIKATEYFNKVIIHYSVFMQMMNINSDRLRTVLWHRGLGLVRLLQLKHRHYKPLARSILSDY